MKNAEANAELTEELAALVPADRVTGVQMGEGFIVIYFDPTRKTDGANRTCVPPLPWSAGYGPVGRIINTVA